MTLPVLLLPCFLGSLWSKGVGSFDPLALFLAQDLLLACCAVPLVLFKMGVSLDVTCLCLRFYVGSLALAGWDPSRVWVVLPS